MTTSAAATTEQLKTGRGIGKGRNPNSLRNLQHDGPEPLYEQKKSPRNLRVTDRGWKGLKALAKEEKLSLAELIEQIGRGEYELIKRS